jgi:hypothetical protein
VLILLSTIFLLGIDMIIYFRVCEKQETLSFVPRWENKDKREIIRKCFLSLQPSIQANDTFIILWDKVRPSTLEWLKAHSATPNVIIQECPISDETSKLTHLDIGLDKRGSNFLNLAAVMDKYTKQFPDEIHYLCNDDFLHLPHALRAIKSVYEDGWTGFVLAYDYPDRYTLDRDRNTTILLNRYSHWRTVPSGTGVVNALGKTWQKYIHLLKQNSLYNSDSFTWEAYIKEGALAPIPGMATHLTAYHLTPRINWKELYESIDIGQPDW